MNILIMNIDDLKIGDIYCIQDSYGFLIFRFNGKNLEDDKRPIANHITDMNGKLVYSKKSAFWFPDRNCRFATYHEQEWFKECESKDTLVSEEDYRIKENNYEIY